MSDAYITEPKMQAESKTMHIHMNYMYACSDSMDMLRRLINCRIIIIIIINLLYTTVYETRATVK